MFFELNKKQSELLRSKKYKELVELGFHYNTVHLLRHNPEKLHVETFAKILQVGFGISWREFSSIK